MLPNLQVKSLQPQINALQKPIGPAQLKPIYGAGCVKNPRIMFIFINPTAKNVSAWPTWRGLRAPWLGTKTVWQLFLQLGLLNPKTYQKTNRLKPTAWTPAFARQVYEEIKLNKAYITNFAKCTQANARPLSNEVFQKYTALLQKEIEAVNPKTIVSFGNQVSSCLLQKPIRVSQYRQTQFELVSIGRKEYKVYPTYYPVGQGRRNLPLAAKRIEMILKQTRP